VTPSPRPAVSITGRPQTAARTRPASDGAAWRLPVAGAVRLQPASALARLLLLAPLLAGSALAQTEPEDAASLDWVPWEQLSPEQQAAATDNNCCGLYVEPELPALDAAAGTTIIDADGMEGEVEGSIRITRGLQLRQDDMSVEAGEGNYERASGRMSVEGRVRVRQRGVLLTGSSATVDQQARRSELHSASYLLHDSGIRGTASVIVYTDEDGIITIDNGLFTRCEPGDDSWSIAGREIELNRNTGRGLARDLTLRVGKVPVLYLPVISFPINDERATGFLAPVMGNTRDGGFDLSAPYYVNLAPNYDMTLIPRIQTKRGVMLGTELRYLGRRHQQELNLNYLPDDKLYDPALAGNRASKSPPVPDRWLLDYEARGRLAPGWSAMVDYSAVSDDEYFQDLGSNGLINTSRSFLQRVARLRYNGENWDFSAVTQAFQIIDPTVTELSQPYRKLPALNLRGLYTQNLQGNLDLEYGVDSEYVYFHRDINQPRFSQAQIDAGALVTGSRLALTPQLGLNWANSYAFATPTLKYKYATWALEDQALGRSASPERGIFSATFDTGLIFERDIDFFDQSLRQTLEPRAFYLYNEYQDQSAMPLFDSSSLTQSYSQLFREDRFSGKDRVGDADQLTLAVSSRFYDEAGRELARASVGQILYFRDRRVTLSNAPDPQLDDSSSSVVGEFSMTLSDNWRAGSYLEWNTTTNELDVANFQFQFQSDINRILNLGYRLREMPGPAMVNGIKRRIDQTDISGVWPLNDRWGLIARWNHDLANNRNLETIAGVEYSNCCWTMRVLARQWIDNNALFAGVDDDNRGVFFQFELKGLGSLLGSNVTGILNNGIRGYRERDHVQ
jgi:LPS-assembly protein